MTRFEIRMFGGLQVVRDGDPIDVTSSKQRALLAILAISPNLTVSTDRVIHDLWHEDPPGQPLSTLRYHLSKLRAILHHEGENRDSFIVTESGGYAMVIEPNEIDTFRHRHLVESAGSLIEINPSAADELIREAASIGEGAPLPEFRYEEFAADFIRRVESEVLHRQLLEVDLHLARGEYDRPIPNLESLSAENPYDEAIYRRLMSALYRSGRASDALGIFKIARTRLGEDLGLEPSPQLTELEDQILLHRVPSAIASRSHRAIPPETSTLVGRESMLEAIDRATAEHRMVTITGLPGVGKSRVALRHAHAVEPSIWLRVPDGADIAEIERLLRSAMQRTLPHVSFEGADVFASMSVVTATVVFDGADRSIETPEVVRNVLRSAPDIRIVATSRTPLGIEGEHTLTMPPLSPRDSLELFRLRSAVPSFEDTSVEAIGTGLPSAIEAAALHYRRFGSLDDLVFEWAQADEDVIGDSSTKDLVRTIALLREPFGLPSMFAVTSAFDEPVRDINDLVDSGVIVSMTNGWAVHPLVRRHLLTSMSTEVVQATLRGLVEIEPAVLSPRAVEQIVAEGRSHGLDESVDRVLAAVAPTWWHTGPRSGRSAVIGLDAGSALDPGDPARELLLYLGAHFALIDNDLAQAIQLIHRHAPSIDAIGALAASRHDQLIANLASYQGDFGTAIERSHQAARTSMSADLPNTTYLLASTGFLDTSINEGVADAHADRVMAAAATRGQEVGSALASEIRGLDAYLRGHEDAARLLLSAAIETYRSLGSTSWATPAVALVAQLECLRGDPARALSLIEEQEQTTIGGSPGALGSAKATAAAMAGDAELARTTLQAASRSLADGTNPIWTYRLLAGAARASDEEPAIGPSASSAAREAIELATRTGIRIPPKDRADLERLNDGDEAPGSTLDLLRRL